MFNKLKAFISNFRDNKFFFKTSLLIGFLFLIYTIINISVYKHWDMFNYPTKKYQILEKEANRLISSHSLNSELKTETTYNSKSNTMKVVLEYKNESVTLIFYNYNEKNETTEIIRENNVPAWLYSLRLLFGFFVIVPILFGMLALIVFIIIIGLLLLLMSAIKKISSKL